ncbi:hypothetical protein ACFLRU_00285 [Bacteroidota bacterium]
MKKQFLYFVLTLLFIAPFATQGQRKKMENPFENKGNIESRFEYLYKTSTNYLEYKVITKSGFITLQKNVKDSISSLKNSLISINQKVTKQSSEIAELQNELLNKNNELNSIRLQKDSIGFFGIQLSKKNYNLIILLIITSLLVTTGFFIFKYKESLFLTKEAQKSLEETQREFIIHQKKSLERQQLLNRKLLDEINKNS